MRPVRPLGKRPPFSLTKSPPAQRRSDWRHRPLCAGPAPYARHCTAAHQHTKVVATVSRPCPPRPSIGAVGTELRQTEGRGRAGRRLGGNVHARSGLLRDPHEDVEAACLLDGLLAQAEHVLVEGCLWRPPHYRCAVLGCGAVCVRAFVLEEARDGDDRLVTNYGCALGAVEWWNSEL